jgi:hypothetical protein
MASPIRRRSQKSPADSISRGPSIHVSSNQETASQYLRNEEVARPFPQTGNWFCIGGASMDALAIFSEGAGRRLQEFTVNTPVMELEGTAAPVRRNWAWSGGGSGGATQIFLPQQALFALVGVGTHLT